MKWGRRVLSGTSTTRIVVSPTVTRSMAGTSCGEMRSAIRLVMRSSSARGSATPTTVPSSSTPMTRRPPAEFANAAIVRNGFVGDDRSRLSSSVFPSTARRWPLSSSSNSPDMRSLPRFASQRDDNLLARRGFFALTHRQPPTLGSSLGPDRTSDS